MPIFFAHNPLNSGARVPIAQRTNPAPQAAQNPIALNPMFGRPNWTYVTLQRSPVQGPDARLAIGSGRTGNAALPGNAAQLPGYLSDNEYLPSVYDYNPVDREDNSIKLPRAVGRGEDGRQLVSTYNSHDFTPADRFFSQNRSASAWQVQSFPPDNRQLLSWQQVQKYNMRSQIIQARPLDSNNYFLGYQVSQDVASRVGGMTGNGVY